MKKVIDNYHNYAPGTTKKIKNSFDVSLGYIREKTAQDIFDTIGTKMQFNMERKQGIVPMKFLGIVNDYNGVEIKQIPYHVKISCKNYINCFLCSYGWEKEEENGFSNISESTQEAVAALHRLEEAIEQEDFTMLLKLESSSKLLEEIRKDPMKVLNRSISMPADCIKKIYKSSGPKEGTVHHKSSEAKFGFSYQTILGELMYAMTMCRPDIAYSATTLSKVSTASSLHHYRS